MIWVRKGIALGLAICAVLGVIYVFLVWMAETASAEPVITNPSPPAQLPGTIDPTGGVMYRPTGRCYDLFARDYCDGPRLQADCLYGSITPDFCTPEWFGESRPVYVGGFRAGDTLRGHEISDALLWAIALEPGFHTTDHRWAVAAAICESGGDQYAENPTSSASGWWQHLLRYVNGPNGRLVSTDYPEGTDFWRPDVQARLTANLYNHGNGASHWNPSRYCWRQYQ